MSTAHMGGLTVIPTAWLPSWPSVGEDARRTVRHGLAHVLAWWGEEPGPKPGEPTHAVVSGRHLLCSSEFADRLATAREAGA